MASYSSRTGRLFWLQSRLVAFLVVFTDKCGLSEESGSVFNPSSYSCSATCELSNGGPSTAIGDFHNVVLDELLPTLHGRIWRAATRGSPLSLSL